MNRTKIEWTDVSWNPVTGCTPVSAGCGNCYGRRMATRLRGRYGYPTDDPFRVTTHPERLEEPLHWKKPRRVFLCSMGDLFHADVPRDFIVKVFEAAHRNPDHVYQFLTKRPERMAEVLRSWTSGYAPGNWWMGTSCEDQASADERIPRLLRCPARVRFVSLEPLLGPVDLRKLCPGWVLDHPEEYVDWVIVGGETGLGARPCHPDWVRSIRDQCAASGVPLFFKGWGEWAPVDDDTPRGAPLAYVHARSGHSLAASRYEPGCPCDSMPSDAAMVRVGKVRTGCLLDGREHKEFPA